VSIPDFPPFVRHCQGGGNARLKLSRHFPAIRYSCHPFSANVVLLAIELKNQSEPVFQFLQLSQMNSPI
jgi:hypothetical protein